jgi:Tol biopolymer transport system component
VQAQPSWSSDGRSIVFSAGVVAGDSDVYRIDADGGQLVRLTRGREGLR